MIDIETHLDLDERSAVGFVAALRRAWANDVYPALIAEQQEALEAGSPRAIGIGDATDDLRRLPLYAWFSHLERQQQKMSWRVVADAVLRRPELVRRALQPTGDGVGGSLSLDPDLELPDWYTDVDIHLQPGAVWTADGSALIYELGARVVMLRDNDGYKFHNLFVSTAMPDIADATCIVDVGCGFGKSTLPLPRRFPTARVIGVDLSAPNLKLAHARAVGSSIPIDFVQASSVDLPLDDSSADLVTGTMVLHEQPADVIDKTISEAARVLKPGGHVRFLEFWLTGDPYFDSTVVGHAERNNEPYFHDLFATDFEALCADVGLENPRWVPFDERDLGLLSDGRPERREWHFPWAVLMAEKPSEQDAEEGDR